MTEIDAEKQCEVIDECLQPFGGYGYMMEYRIANLWADARLQKIYGGANDHEGVDCPFVVTLALEDASRGEYVATYVC